MSVRDVWSAAVRLRDGDDQRKGGRRQCRKTERLRGGGKKDLRRNRTPGIFLMIGNRAGTRRDGGLMPRQVRMERPAVMMSRLHVVEMHVHQRRGNRPRLHEDDEDGGGQPAEHERIVVNPKRRRA